MEMEASQKYFPIWCKYHVSRSLTPSNLPRAMGELDVLQFSNLPLGTYPECPWSCKFSCSFENAIYSMRALAISLLPKEITTENISSMAFEHLSIDIPPRPRRP